MKKVDHTDTRKQPLKILATLASIDPRDGGPPSSARNMWMAARRTGVDVSAAVCMERAPLAAELMALRDLKESGVITFPFPFSRFFTQRAMRWGGSEALGIWLLRRAGQYDVIQVHGAWVFSTLIAVLAAKLHGRPVLLIPHESLTGFDIVTNASPFKRGLKRLLKRCLLCATDMIVFSSYLEQQDSVDKGHAAKSVVIYHPVYDERDGRYERNRLSEISGTLRVGYMGRLHPKKNLELLIEAIAKLPGVSLRIAGAGPDEYRARLVDLIDRLGTKDRVEWVGFLSGQAKRDFFGSIDVLAMPSAYECFGRVAAEAMVCGVPTIVSDTTGISEVVARYECGLVVPPNAEALRIAIEELRRNPAPLKDFTRRAVQACEKELSLKSYGDAITSVYRQFVPKKTPSGNLSSATLSE